MEVFMQKEYFGFVTMAGGGGSFARESSKYSTVRNCLVQFVQSWSSMFETNDCTVSVSVWDITGYNKITLLPHKLLGWHEGEDLDTEGHEIKQDRFIKTYEFKTPKVRKNGSVFSKSYTKKLEALVQNQFYGQDKYGPNTYHGHTEITVGDRESFYYKKKATIVSKGDGEDWNVRIGNFDFTIKEKHMTIGFPPDSNLGKIFNV